MDFDIASGRAMIVSNSVTGECLNILFTGDLCPLGETEKLITGGKAGDVIGSFLPLTGRKDILVSNLEAPLTRAETPIKKTGPNLKLDPSCVELLKMMQLDAACLANNHIGDYGTGAVMETIEILERNGIMKVGAGAGLEDAFKPLIFEKKDRRIAMLAFAENEFGTAEKGKPGSAPLDPLSNIKQIRDAARQADITIVIIHGGNEYNPVPSPRMVKTYRAFTEAGASAVIAMHPHCPQGFEIHEGKPIVYSLGNFLFEKPGQGGANIDKNDMWWKGYMVNISFSKDRAVSLEVIPHRFCPFEKKFSLLEGEGRDEFLKYLSHLSGIIEDEQERELMWQGWCAMKGPQWMRYLDGAAYAANIDGEELNQRVYSARNMFTCEAHNELAATYLRMLCDGRVEAALKQTERIMALQKGIIKN
jgi:hypothetical protein